MIHRATADFWSDYNALPAEIRGRADKQFTLLKINPQHPSLHFKKLGERKGQEIWSVRVSLKYRALAVKFPMGTCGFELVTTTFMTQKPADLKPILAEDAGLGLGLWDQEFLHRPSVPTNPTRN